MKHSAMPAALELSALLWPHKIGTEKVILNGSLLARKGDKIKPGVSLYGYRFDGVAPVSSAEQAIDALTCRSARIWHALPCGQ